ncbi:MAG: ABC transporter ATP-binding protein/permease [Candidatus Parcubacteria bacterium]|nr:ABC transporter ATP-binding protein/permease [Candidatus Parcubacteria bacterium]
MISEKKKPARVWPVLRAYGKAALVYPWSLCGAVVAAIAIEVANVVAPLYLRQFIDLLSGGTPTQEVVRAIFIALLFFTTTNLVSWLAQRLRLFAVNKLESRTMVDLYQNAFDYLIRHSHEFFISNFTGTLTRRVTRYARAFEQVFDTMLFNFFPALLFAVGIIGVLSMRSVLLGAGLFVWTVVFVYLQFRMMLKRQPLRIARTEEDSRVTGFLSDAVLNHSTITAFAAVPFESLRFRDTIQRWYVALKRVWDADLWVYGIQGLLAVGIEFALLAGAVLLWQKGLVTVGDFVLIQIYILGLFNRIWNIGQNMRQLYDAFADATEMLDIMELPHEIKNARDAEPLVVKEGAITFDHVHFEYRDGHSLLKDFSLEIQPREKIALVGSSGAGKSTITKLLLRLYEVGSGTISIDGQNIAQATQESLRRAIAFVPQEPMLFHRSLMDNIRYGRQDATDKEVMEAAKQAHCHEFISQYPEGFNTMVGERGVKLSGGERQRVAIARAILKNAPILVLDEATSSLDSESERLIQDALLRLMEGKTVIAIAHRLSTVMHMDRLIIIEKGSVILSGTHEELLSHESNLYKKLWEIQAGGFLRKD